VTGTPDRRSVFINCPFDDQYQPLFQAIVFTILRCGFMPKCALEIDDAGQNRFEKIVRLMRSCRLSVHDISRTESDGVPPLPRFNMPFELGLFLGLSKTGTRRSSLIFDREQFRYQRFLSDIAGQDIRFHANDSAILIREMSAWLRHQDPTRRIPGGAAIHEDFGEYGSFRDVALPRLELRPEEVTFNDEVKLIYEYLQPDNA
jgi:hypothetical protein